MAKSRVEKYREYRKSILTEGSPTVKTAIDTSLETTSMESNTSPTYQEAVFLKHVVRKERFGIFLFILAISAIIVTSLVFGLILF